MILAFRSAAEIARALPDVVAHLQAGGLVAYPTETVYGLGSRARDVQELAALKGRGPAHPVLLLVSDRAMVEAYGLAFNACATALAQAFWPGPLTLVLPGGDARVPDELRGAGGGIAVRWTSHMGAARLVAALGEPLTSTSANRAQQAPGHDARGIATAFEAAVRAGQLLILDGGVLGNSPPSTVVDCTAPRPRLVREGAVAWSSVCDAVGAFAP